MLDDDVMISPQAVLTEDRTPRATRPGGQCQDLGDWTSAPVIVRRGATVGAGARVAPGIEIGPYALVGIGAIVLRDVAQLALVLGNPGRACGWGLPLRAHPRPPAALPAVRPGLRTGR